ncbi:MAG: GNAT family N-acetyltransferase [Anaerolineae bacterium]|nr:GNAT family N-acetyltransferase [Anaerolineae bacterium]
MPAHPVMNPLLLDPPETTETLRLVLRRYQPGDAPAYFAMLERNREHLRDFMPPAMESVHSPLDAELLIRQFMVEWQARNLFIFGIWEKESRQYVGEAYLANADWSIPCIELGYFIARDWTRRGFAVEAARALLALAFEHLRVVRVELQCAADNPASAQVAERCGFRLEGRHRNRARHKDGPLVDRLWYGLLREEWTKPSAAVVEGPSRT